MHLFLPVTVTSILSTQPVYHSKKAIYPGACYCSQQMSIDLQQQKNYSQDFYNLPDKPVPNALLLSQNSVLQFHTEYNL